MKITKKRGKGNTLSFEIHDSVNWYVNTIRRLILNEVPTMAIELVEFKKNDSILYDEIIAHRLGLIPLKTDLKSYKQVTDEELETDEYLAQSSVTLTLKAKGPCVVYAKDLKSKDPKIVPVYPDMPIVKLLEGQVLEVEATAVLGKGKRHMKWSPGHAYFKALDEEGTESKDFLFSIESWGQLTPKRMVTAAMEEYDAQLKEFATLLGSL